MTSMAGPAPSNSPSPPTSWPRGTRPPPPAPTGGAVVEGALLGATVGITALSVDPGGTGAVTYTLTNSAGGLFAIDSSGVVTVTAAGAASIDYETSGGSHSFGITVDAFDGT